MFTFPNSFFLEETFPHSLIDRKSRHEYSVSLAKQGQVLPGSLAI